jgi:hypothetical protein
MSNLYILKFSSWDLILVIFIIFIVIFWFYIFFLNFKFFFIKVKFLIYLKLYKPSKK